MKRTKIQTNVINQQKRPRNILYSFKVAMSVYIFPQINEIEDSLRLIRHNIDNVTFNFYNSQITFIRKRSISINIVAVKIVQVMQTGKISLLA